MQSIHNYSEKPRVNTHQFGEKQLMVCRMVSLKKSQIKLRNRVAILKYFMKIMAEWTVILR